jgi:hypothetical protein
MVPIDAVRRYGPHPETVAIVVANGFPLVGVVALGWDLVALVSLYWFELGVLTLWALGRALVAGRPSEFDEDPLLGGALANKRAAIPLPSTGLEIRLSSLPVLVAATPVLAAVWFLAGVTTVGVIGRTPDEAALGSIALAVIGLFVSEGGRTALEYVHRGGYREHSAQTAIRGVFTRGVVVALGGMVTALVVGLGTDSVAPDESLSAVDPAVVGPPLLIGIVLVKFGFDLAGRYSDRLVALDEDTTVELGWAYDPPAADPIDPVASVERRPRPTLAGRLLGGLSPAHVTRHPGALIPGSLLAVASLLFAIGGAWAFVALLVAAGVVVSAGLLATDWWVRYAGLEYRVSGEAIVAYDRLFRTRVWRIEPWDERGLRVERGRLHRWLGTTTVVVVGPDRERRLPHLREPDAILEVFDRRADGP